MTPRYKLRTLLILLAILPPLLWIGWGKYQAWKAEQERRQLLRVWSIESGSRLTEPPVTMIEAKRFKAPAKSRD
jgi:hypothetical protein